MILVSSNFWREQVRLVPRLEEPLANAIDRVDDPVDQRVVSVREDPDFQVGVPCSMGAGDGTAFSTISHQM